MSPWKIAFWAVFGLVAFSATTAGIAYRATNSHASALPSAAPSAIQINPPLNGQHSPAIRKPSLKATHRPTPSTTTRKPSPRTTTDAPAYYANCAAARRAGAAPLLAGEPGYRRKLDRDGDGVACS